MKEFLFATNNKNKILEIQNSWQDDFLKCYTLQDIHFYAEIPEPYDTIAANAEAKVDFLIPHTKYNIFAEDTGLEVLALNGEPGVRSARYAGEEANAEKNIQKLLFNMRAIKNRVAQFKTVICCYYKNEKHFFTGICKGTILYEAVGKNGFGYDAVFMPDGGKKSFGEMDLQEKKQYSHREKSLQRFLTFLKKYNSLQN